MRKNPHRIVKYLVGLSLALIAVSNCLNVLSNSSISTALVAGPSSIDQVNEWNTLSDQSLIGLRPGGSPLEPNRRAAPISPFDLATRASVLSPVASPFAPTITATKSHMLAPADTQADPGDTLTYTVVITNSGTTDATDVNFSDTIDPNTTFVPGSLIVSPIAVNDSYNTIGNVNIDVPAPGLLGNDLNPNGSGTLSIQSPPTTTTNGGTLSINAATGAFTYDPPVGFEGSDTFSYTLANSATPGKTDTATVTITVSGMIWFINNNAGACSSSCDGRLSHPFTSIAAFQAVNNGSGSNPAAGDSIFLYSSGANYSGPLTLLNTQKLIGQGAPDSILTITGLMAPSGTTLLPMTNGTDPVITGTNITAITLGQNNQLHGFTVGNTGATGIDILGATIGSSPGLTIKDVTVNGSGQALDLASGTIVSGSTFATIESTGGSPAEGLQLAAVGGSFTATTTNIVNPTGTGIDVQSSPSGTSFNFGSTTVNKGASIGTGVNLNSNTGTFAFSSLTVTTSNGTGVSATSSGTVNVTTGSISATGGPALLVNPTTLGMTFTTVSSTNSTTTGISLTSASGSLTIGTTTVTNPTGIGISVNTSSAALSFGATTSTQSGGTGVSLTSNTGTISFGALIISPDSGQRGLLATDNTMTITTASGAISTSGAIPVEITRASGTTPLAVSLTSVSLNSPSGSGGANGIKLTNTSGSFTVTGNGGVTNDGSGGTISGATAEGVLISTASNISLGYMIIQNYATDGIHATSVNGFTLNRSNVTDTANNAVTDNGVELDNASGTVTISNCSITGPTLNGVDVDNNNTNLSSFSMTNTTVSNNSPTLGNDGLLLQMRGTSVLTTGNVQSCTFSGLRATAVQIQTADTAIIASNDPASTNNFTVQTSTFTNNNIAMDFTLSQSGSIKFKILNNTSITGHNSHAINVFSSATSGSAARLNGVIQGNQIGTQGIKDSGSRIGNGIRVVIQGNSLGNVEVDGNTIREVVNATILNFVGQNGNAVLGTGSAKFKITNNSMPAPSGSNQSLCGPANTPCAEDGIFILADEGNPVCAVVTGNTIYDVTTMNGVFDVYLAERAGPPAGAQLTIQGTGAVTTFINANNTLAGPNMSVDEGGNVLTTASCSFPAIAMASAELAIQSAGTNPQPDDQAGETSTTRDALTVVETQRRDESDVPLLSQEELNSMVEAAIARWAEAGISPEEMARFREATFEIADLPGSQLVSTSGKHIRIDQSAAGYGWFFDQFPAEDSEFDVPVSDKERQATELSPAHGKVDLLTVLVREFGSIYLQDKKRNISKKYRTLMETTLAPTVRRMPLLKVPETSPSTVGTGAGHAGSTTDKVSQSGTTQSNSAATLELLQSDAALPLPLRYAVFNPSAGQAQGSYGRSAKRMSYAAGSRRFAAFNPALFSGETVPKSIGTIPAGESVTIMFQVTIDSPFPSGVCTVTNVGHVTGSNFSPVDTNSDVTTVARALTIGACPENITTNNDSGLCTAVVTYTTPTADGCPVPTVTCDPASGFAFPKGTTTVTCTASNGNPPDATCTFTVTVKDNEAPTCNLPPNITQNNDTGQCTAVVSYTATASDNCGGATIVCNPASGSTFPAGTTTVNCTASDDSPDSPDTDCSFTVTVKDTEAPTCNLPANITQNNDAGQCSAVVTYTATASDNCDGATIVCNPASGSTFPVGTTTVNCTASDTSSDSPNTDCSFTVTVKDTQAPTLTACPANISVTSASACQVVTYTPPTAADNCGSATVICSPPSGFCFPAGTTTVTCTASDTSPDSPDAMCSFMVSVVPCSITCPSNIMVNNDPGLCGATVNFAPTATPGCGTVMCSPSSGSFFPVGTTTVTCNTQAGPSCSFTVEVNDTEGPQITLTTGTIELWPPNHDYTTVIMSQLVASATDDCDGNLINSVKITSVSSDEPQNAPGKSDGNTNNDIVIAADCKSVQLRAERDDNLNGRVYTINLKVTDAAGNVTTASRTVIVPLNQSGGGAILGPGPGYSVTSSCP